MEYSATGHSTTRVIDVIVIDDDPPQSRHQAKTERRGSSDSDAGSSDSDGGSSDRDVSMASSDACSADNEGNGSDAYGDDSDEECMALLLQLKHIVHHKRQRDSNSGSGRATAASTPVQRVALSPRVGGETESE
ncbi:unnamed protein product [Phytophthora lilii]|uniref:Unnamed protein product n=1 Tax=Phytophthora lilii TaxID=2077276 RepID=A0A9W6TAZ7_9STRA|nr:unnamed protein product [Phytophthora lilii]